VDFVEFTLNTFKGTYNQPSLMPLQLLLLQESTAANYTHNWWKVVWFGGVYFEVIHNQDSTNHIVQKS